MGKKASNRSNPVPQTPKEATRPKLSKTEKRKIYLALLLSISALVVGYFVIKSFFIPSYDRELGGIWQVNRIILEKTDSDQQDQVAIDLVTKDEKEGPNAVYRVLSPEDLVHTEVGDKELPELGAYRIELMVDDLTLYPEVDSILREGIIEVATEEGKQGILKRIRAFILPNGQTAFYFGFDEEPQITFFESTAEAVRIQFSPVGFEAEAQ